MDYKQLADFLFPNIKKNTDEIKNLFPKRKLSENAKVTRLAPSPTGFIHLGNLYGAFVDERLAHQSDGIFYLRIEDTDEKRYVKGAVKTIIDSLNFFGIKFDEGATDDNGKEIGSYGPYTQSLRKEIYQVFAKELIAQGKAYPCFLNEDEINGIRSKQEKIKANPGIYGKWAIHRNLSFDEIKERVNNNLPYVIRLKSDGNLNVAPDSIRKITVEDGIRGTLEMPENELDIVILKSNGMPTYHFAHVVDDSLMGTTHVVRGEEWLSTLPIHIELFEKLGLEHPVYCHTGQLMKIGENGTKRKLSKRKDPELALDYYRELGYHPTALREYLLTVLNSNFEEWRTKNPLADIDEFKFTTEKMSNSGSLFDLQKLDDVSKDVLLKISAPSLFDFLKNWYEQGKQSDTFKSLIKESLSVDDLGFLFENRRYLEKVLDIGRNDNKPRKDHIYALQMVKNISYFFDEIYKVEDDFPPEAAEDKNIILKKYLETYNHGDTQEEWFKKIRTIAENLGYAARPKDYKKNPDDYKGHVGHISSVIRIAVMGRLQSPDVWEIQQILGEDSVRKRIECFL